MASAREAVVHYFLEMHISLREEWLDMVLRFLREHHNVNTTDKEKLCTLVYEQWLYSDIAESMEPSRCLANPTFRISTLKDPIVMQIKSVLDVSESFYSQVKSNNKNFVDNSGFEALTENEKETFREAQSRRTLSVLLTNGAADFKAIEHKPINDISVATTPGTKVLLIPPIKCRRGQFFIGPKNVQILGGDLESYIQMYNPLQLMADLIKIKLTKSPKKTAPLPPNANTTAVRAPPQTTSAVAATVHAPPPRNPAPRRLISIAATTAPTIKSPGLRNSPRRSLASIQETVEPPPPKRSITVLNKIGQQNLDTGRNRQLNESMVSKRILERDDFDNSPPRDSDQDDNDFLNNVIVEVDSDDDDEISRRSRTRRTQLNRVANISRSSDDNILPSTSYDNSDVRTETNIFDDNDCGFATQFNTDSMQTPPSIFVSPIRNRTGEILPEDIAIKPNAIKRKSEFINSQRSKIASPTFMPLIFTEEDPDFVASTSDKEQPFSLLHTALEAEFGKNAPGPVRNEATARKSAPSIVKNPFSTVLPPEKPTVQPVSRLADYRNANLPLTPLEPVQKRTRLSEPEIPPVNAPPAYATAGKTEQSRARSCGIQRFFEPTISAMPAALPSKPMPLKEVKHEVIEISDDEVDVKPDIKALKVTPHKVEIEPIPSPSVIMHTPATNITNCSNTSTHSESSLDVKNSYIKKYLALKAITIIEARNKMRYTLNTKIFNINAIVQDVTQGVHIVEGMWTMQVKIKDTSAHSVLCFLHNDVIQGIIGKTADEATRIKNSTDTALRADCNERLQNVFCQLRRLDLIMEVEFANSGKSVPIIRKISPIHELVMDQSQ